MALRQDFNSQEYIDLLYKQYEQLSDDELDQKFDELLARDEKTKEHYQNELANLLNIHFPNKYSIKLFYFNYITVEHNVLKDFYFNVDCYTDCDTDSVIIELVFPELSTDLSSLEKSSDIAAILDEEKEILSNANFLKCLKDIAETVYRLDETGLRIIHDIQKERKEMANNATDEKSVAKKHFISKCKRKS